MILESLVHMDSERLDQEDFLGENYDVSSPGTSDT